MTQLLMRPLVIWLGCLASSAAACGGGDRPEADAGTPVPRPSTAPATASIPAAPPRGSLPSSTWLSALGVSVTKIHREPRVSWRQIGDLNWQAIAPESEPMPAERARESGGCEQGMLRVAGAFLVDEKGRDDTDRVESLQNSTCRRWRTADHGLQGLCDRFDRVRWLQATAALARQQMSFCVDRYEFPNVYGEYPLVVVTYSEAQKYCERVGKRLCSESEWTFACEGEQGLPYPYGFERDATACAIDIFGPGPDKDMFAPRTTAHTARAIDRSWRGRRAGQSPRCISPFGVEDMTGNVDEWTRSVRRYGYRMIMKGGHWGPARQRCRPQTRGHGPFYVRYDQGFRCCKDAPRAEPR